MSIFSNQSDIGEVRDQLSLDYADGKYLNVVSSNLGVQRPPFGFSDDVWRALVKAISLQYKQVNTKFEEILSIILGPKVTQVGALLTSTTAGDRHAVLVNSAQFPQIGTMVIDEGLATEETVEYCYIDRYTNTVYFNTPLVNSHIAIAQEWESGIISDVAAGATRYNVFDASGFPDPSIVAYPLVVGRGTSYETVGSAVSVNASARLLEGPVLSSGGPGIDTSAGMIVVGSSTASQEETYYLTLADVEQLASTQGKLQVELSTAKTASGGTTNSVSVAGPLTANKYGGYWIRFTGNITAALENFVAYVEDNTTTDFLFGNTLPGTPAAGDTFYVIANFEYIRTDADEDTVLMRDEFPDLNIVDASVAFTVLKPQMTAAIGQVQVKGVAWDVFQSDPRHVEILLPVSLLESDLRSAAYIRDATLDGTAEADEVRAVGSTEFSVLTTANMPLIGVLNHAASGTRYAYYVPNAYLTSDVLAGATEIPVTDTTQFLSSGTLRIGVSTVSYTVVDNTTIGVTPLPTNVSKGTVVKDAKRLRIAKESTATVNITDTLDFYADYDLGDMWDVPDVWAGPYVWDAFSEIHKEETVPDNSFSTNISGPTVLTVDRLVGSTVFEVADASSFPTSVPFNVLIGENSGNIETLAVQEVSLKSRTYETTTTAVTPADSPAQVVLNSLAGPLGPLNTFPDGGPYRIVIRPFSANAEVLEVTGTNGVDTLFLSQNSTLTHPIGSDVVLLSDLLRVSPACADDHTGNIFLSNRFGYYAPETQTGQADMVRPLYTSATLNLAGTDFEVSNGNAVINFGNTLNVLRTRLDATLSTTTVSVDNSSAFPTSGYPYAIYVDVGAGPLKEEVLHVTNNNIGTNEFTVSHPPVFTHEVGRIVEFRPGPQENLSYTSRTGSVLSFEPYALVSHTHYEAERVAPTVGTGYPRRTGYDFPLRLPVTVEDRIRFMVDLVRAAGIEVTFVSKR